MRHIKYGLHYHCGTTEVYCLGYSCNDVAWVLFKMDHAWTEGITNKSCPSKPTEWPQPKKGGSTDAKKIKNMERCIRKSSWGYAIS
ncbi:Hypp857 [Branchiostoma lanceolatum]|uniref:Hypp857 protein n=1 Tax=Branchiostoma lanceolatum TaxID=7740 RepID=A0A8J9YPV6_BRALA|nr:Hypp857 [Branchiostoma lanceolatum]